MDKHVRRELDCTPSPTPVCINTDYDPGSVVSTAQSNNNNFLLFFVEAPGQLLSLPPFLKSGPDNDTGEVDNYDHSAAT